MEAVATYSLLKFILDVDFSPIEGWCDNSAAVDCVKRENTMALRHNVERHKDYAIDCASKDLVTINWINSVCQQADIFTKALAYAEFSKFRAELLNTEN